VLFSREEAEEPEKRAPYDICPGRANMSSGNEEMVLREYAHIQSWREESDISSIDNLHKQRSTEYRERFVRLLRTMPTFLEMVKKLQEGTTYRAVFSIEGQKLLRQGSARLGKRGIALSANLHDSSGKFIEQARLEGCSPDFVSSMNQLWLQQTMASVLESVSALGKRLDQVLTGLHNDRLALVKGAGQICRQAIAAHRPENRQLLFGLAIAQATEGRERLLLNMEADIHTLAALEKGESGSSIREMVSMITGPRQEQEIQEKAQTIQQSLQGVLTATRVLVLCYEELNEPESLVFSLGPLQEGVSRFGTQGELIARHLPYDPQSPPEKIWGELVAKLEGKIEETRRKLDLPQGPVVEVRLRGREFLKEANKWRIRPARSATGH